MDGEAADGEGWVEGAEAVDVVDHAEEDRRGEGGVGGQALEVVGHGNARWGAGMETGQVPGVDGELVVVAD